jgi:hypothetical protein
LTISLQEVFESVSTTRPISVSLLFHSQDETDKIAGAEYKVSLSWACLVGKPPKKSEKVLVGGSVCEMRKKEELPAGTSTYVIL